ncbi:hypothetical protein EVG20_g837 [Dentipellis fragilis]|uniref:Uncharacterized protein n=1 Tax=Dentipellis fragilis TaxID=205917 RepID=A0A4Y9ZDE5_9AGAM|nr:hypothetical protein EVG20_g837 [Dentipellis fragilis]
MLPAQTLTQGETSAIWPWFWFWSFAILIWVPHLEAALEDRISMQQLQSSVYESTSIRLRRNSRSASAAVIHVEQRSPCDGTAKA